MNKVVLMGRLTADPEKAGTKEQPIAKYLLAVDRISKNSDEADFIRCTCFGNNAKFAAEYLKKGMKIALVGSIHTSTYKDKEDNTRYSTEVYVNEHYFCEKKSDSDKKSTKKKKEDSSVDWD